MVQQIIIAQAEALPAFLLLRFAATAGLLCSLVLGVLAFTPLGASILLGLLGGEEVLFAAALPVIRMGCVLPLLVAAQNAIQGYCIVEGANWSIQQATMGSLATTLVVTWSGISWGQPGALAAILGMLSGLVVEVVLLGRGSRLSRRIKQNGP
jgi:hypothetical protein